MLNAAQQRAVELRGHLVCTACPGSGKTKVMEHRAARILAEDRDALVCAVAFSREAAEALEHRIKKTAGPNARRVRTGTIHSLCKAMIEQARGGKRVQLATAAHRQFLIKRAYGEAYAGVSEKDALPFEEATAAIDLAKAKLWIPDEKDRSPLANFCRIYDEQLTRQGLWDFGDLISNAVWGMEGRIGLQVAPLPVTHLLVDEFQDVDPGQLRWALAHAARDIETTVVGDDDQSIFKFRASMGYEAIVAFQREVNAAHVTLDTTYRCPARVIHHASKLISNNIARVPKSIRTANRATGRVALFGCPSVEAEFSLAAEEIAADLSRPSHRPGDWAVLARTNDELAEFESAVGGRFPVRRIGGKAFWEMPHPALFLSILHALANGTYAGLDAFMDRAGVSDAGIERITLTVAPKAPGSLARYLSGAVSGLAAVDASIDVAVRTALNASVQSLRLGEQGMPAALASIQSLYLDRISSRDADKTKRFIDAGVNGLLKRSGPLAQRLRDATRVPKSNEEAVTAMTMHASKGLEYKRVWLLGWTAGSFPGPDAVGDEAIAEERRLAYVAMTRAIEALHISFKQAPAGTSKAAPNAKPAGPSPFLVEAQLIDPAP
jgi:superfamily I DNA/RNA helicase